MKQVNSISPCRILVLLLGLFLSVGAFAQITVKGHVKDAEGEPVIGAAVRVVGTQTGVVSDFDGNFTVKASQGATLQVSYVGYQTATVKAAPNVVVTLVEDAKMLDNVVVIGYGVAKKNDLTGSVVAIKPDEKNRGLVTTAQDMIQGKIAGVNVNTTTGEPGGAAQIRIRGGASLNANNDPLIVIDGMPMDGNKTKGMANPLSLVNPNDIESFTILKDASATAIYGSRGSNGVVIITTKKGRKNQAPQVSYNATFSLSTKDKTLDVMDAGEYVQFIKNKYGDDSDAYKGLGWKKFNADGTPDFAAGTYDTDWQDEIYRSAVSHDHNLSISGGVGNEKWSMPYRVSAGYTSQNGILKKSDYSRFTAGFSLNPSLLQDHLNLNINGKYSYVKANKGGTDAIGEAVKMDPTRPVRSDDPRYINWGGYWQWTKTTSAFDPTFPYAVNDDAPKNPLEKAVNNNYYEKAHVLIGNIEADYKIHGFEDLHLHLNLAGEYTTGGQYTDYDPQTSYGFYYSKLAENTEKKYNLVATAYAQYLKDFAKAHHIDVMAGYEYSRMKYWGDEWAKTFYPLTNQQTYDDGTPRAGTVNSSNESRWRGQQVLVSWYGRLNYTLLDRYLFTFTARYDGSSRFADGERWGFFPSAAFAWRVKSEPFLRDVDAVSDLKLRLGWGKTGQQDTQKDYYSPTYKVNNNPYYTYPIGPNNPGWIYQPLAYNNDLTWETTTTWNVGLDLGFFNQRLTLTADAYLRKTTDLMCTTSVPAGQNFDNKILMNAGELENKGIELALTGRPIQTNNWFVELGVNAGYNKNEVTELYGGYDQIQAGMSVGTNEAVTYHKIGKPANSFWVYQQAYDEAGRPIMGCYVDRNADGQIDENDRYFYKQISAPWTGGFSMKISYKNWDLGTNWRASWGNYVYNDLQQGCSNVAECYNSKGYYTNTTSEMAYNNWSSYNYSLSDYWVQNASFLKCDNITLGYSFSGFGKDNKYKGLSGRIYASCSNVFTITDYDGLDPEQTTGKESSLYPRSRTFLLGLNLNF